MITAEEYCRKHWLNPETLEYSADMIGEDKSGFYKVIDFNLLEWFSSNSGKESLCAAWCIGVPNVNLAEDYKEWFSFNHLAARSDFEYWWTDRQSEEAYLANPNPPLSIKEAVKRQNELRIPKFVRKSSDKYGKLIAFW